MIINDGDTEIKRRVVDLVPAARQSSRLIRVTRGPSRIFVQNSS